MEEKVGVLEKTLEPIENPEGIADIGANGEPGEPPAVLVKKLRAKTAKTAAEENPQEPVLSLRQFAFSRGLTSVKRAGFEAWLLSNILGVRHTATEFDVLLKEFER